MSCDWNAKWSVDDVAAEPLTQLIVETYFSGLDTETRYDVFDMIRNFILDQQETNAVYVYEDETPCEVVLTFQNMEKENEDKDSDESDDDMVSVTSEEEPKMDDESETDETSAVTPYTSHTVDAIEIYFQVRALYEEHRCGPFDTFRDFYARAFTSSNC